MRGQRVGVDILGHFDNQLGNENVEATPTVGPPSAAQERREPVTPARHRRTGPLCAADPCPAA